MHIYRTLSHVSNEKVKRTNIRRRKMDESIAIHYFFLVGTPWIKMYLLANTVDD